MTNPDVPPFAGYEDLNEKEVIASLRKHSQAELEAVENYECAHENRLPVLDKLRFMRQSEPFPGYDALGSDKIVPTLGEADIATLKKIRGYERKFADRPAVLDEVARLHRQRREAEPAKAVPSYQPLSASP